MGLTTEEYYIGLVDGTPVKSYVLRGSPAVVEAIESEIESLEGRIYKAIYKSVFSSN